MPPIFSLSVAALLAAIPATYALDHYVTVGKGGNKYDPPFVQAKIGDKVKFQL
jgi:plastocyanin